MRSFFLGISYTRSILYTNYSNLCIFAFSEANFCSLPQKLSPHAHQLPDSLFTNQTKIYFSQLSTPASIVDEKSRSFKLTIYLLWYHLIGIHSNIIYNYFIIEWSYEYLRWNLSNQFRSINDHMHTFDRQYIDQIK